jgi:hypothetical protein
MALGNPLGWMLGMELLLSEGWALGWLHQRAKRMCRLSLQFNWNCSPNEVKTMHHNWCPVTQLLVGFPLPQPKLSSATN